MKVGDTLGALRVEAFEISDSAAICFRSGADLASIWLRLPICRSIHLFIRLSIYRFSIIVSIHPSIYLCIHLSNLFIYLSLYLSIYVSSYGPEGPFITVLKGPSFRVSRKVSTLLFWVYPGEGVLRFPEPGGPPKMDPNILRWFFQGPPKMGPQFLETSI